MAHDSAGEIRSALDAVDVWGRQVDSEYARALLDRELGGKQDTVDPRKEPIA